MPGGKSPGPSIKNPDVYEALRRKGMSKQRAAQISNAQAKKASEIHDRMHDLPQIPEQAFSELTTKKRKALPKAAFALPGRRYPIHDEAHARNALARVAQHGTPAEQAAVKRAVKRKFPGLAKRSSVIKTSEPVVSRRERLYTALKVRRG